MKRFLLSIFFLISTHALVADQKNRTNPVPQDPLIIRLYADPYAKGVKQSPEAVAAGNLNRTFGIDGGRDLTSVFGKNTQAQAIRILPNGKSIIAVDDLNCHNVKIARFDGDGYLDECFATSGICTIAQENVTNLYIDSLGRILVVGGDCAGSWIARLTCDGNLDVDNFGGADARPSSPAGMLVGNVSVGFNAIGQQRSGRLIVGATDSSSPGSVWAIRTDGTLDLSFAARTPNDNDFLPAWNRAQFGIADAAGHGVYDIAIDPLSDAIYAAYVDASNNASVAKILADGDNYDTCFGDQGLIAVVDRIPNITDSSQVRAVLDQNKSIVIAAVNSSNQYVLRRYLSSGSVDTNFNGDGSIFVFSGSATSVITHLMMTQANQMLVVGYDDSAENNFIMFRVKANGTLDCRFSETGILPFQLNDGDITKQFRFGAIHPTGEIYAVGFEHDLADSPCPKDNPVVVNVYGDSFVPELKQAPGASRSGTLDNTFNRGTSPTIIVNQIYGLCQLAETHPKLMHVFYDNPGYLLVSEKCRTTYITKLTQDMELDPTFNCGNLIEVTTGDNYSQLNGLAFDKFSGAIDSAQKFFLVGTNYSGENSTPWALRYSSHGHLDCEFNLAPLSEIVTGNAIDQQSFGRVIIGGQTECGKGILTGYTVYGEPDLGFGNTTGKFVIPCCSAPIYAMAIDGQDRIVVAYKDECNHLSIVRVDESGLRLDCTFNVTDKISCVACPDQVQLALDQNGNIVVAVPTAIGYKVRRYNQVDGSLDTSFNGSGQLEFQFSGSTGTPVLTKLLVESSGKILILGFNSAADDYRAIQARLLSTGYLDCSFNRSGTPQGNGILEIYNGTQQFEYFSEGVQLDRRISLFGRNGLTGDILLTRLYGDDCDYVTTFDTEPVAGIDGMPDLSLLDQGYENLTDLVGHCKAKIIRALEYGKTIIAVDNGCVTKLIRLTTESKLDCSFNGGGIATTTCPTGVTDILIDSDNKILVVGTSSHSWLRRYNADGSNDAGFGTAGLVTTNIDTGYKVTDQSGQRLIVCGSNSDGGCLIGYTPNGILDASFGGGTGIVHIGPLPVHDIVLDFQNKIYVAYDDGNHYVTLARYHNNGTSLDTTFGDGGIVTDAVHQQVTGPDQIFLGLDQNEYVVVAGASCESLLVTRYNTSGGYDGEFGETDGGFTEISVNHIKLQDLLIGHTPEYGCQRVIALVGYKDNCCDEDMFIAWLNETGQVDIDYNPTGVEQGIPGTVEFTIDECGPVHKLRSGAFLNDGRIVVVGYERDHCCHDVPLLMRRYGLRYAAQVIENPAFGLPGVLDPSLNGSGTWTFDFTSGAVNQFANSIRSLSTGNFIIGGYGTVNTDLVNYHFIVSKIDNDGHFDGSFGDGGVTVQPLLVANQNEYLYEVAIDYLGRVIAVGYSDAGVALIRRYLPDGTLDTTFGDESGNPLQPTGTASVANMQFFGIEIQLNGRLIAIGTDTVLNKGVIVAFDLEGKIDPTFGNHGVIYIHDAVALHSLIIDTNDSIVVVYQNESGRANITRMSEDGLPYTGSTFSSYGAVIDIFGVEVTSADTVKVTRDKNDNIVVAASIAGTNTIQIRRYLPTGAVDTSFNTDGSAMVLAIGVDGDTSTITRLMSNSVGQYVIVGYENYFEAATIPFVAQATSTGILDVTFDAVSSQPGVNAFTIAGGGTDQQLMGATISIEGKIVAVGQELLGGYYTPVQVALFDYAYSPEIQRSPTFVPEGGFDQSFGDAGETNVYAGAASNELSGQEVKAVRQLSSLKLITVVSNGNQSLTVRVDSDGTNDATYGDGQGILINQYSGAEVVNQMQLDGVGNPMVVGTHSVYGGYLKRILADGTMNLIFGGNNGQPKGCLYNIMSEIYAVAQLSNGDMIVTGNNNGVGTAMMIKPNSDIDTALLVSGVYTNGTNIASVAVDAQDNIYMAIGYNDGTNNVRIVKMNKNAVLDQTFNASGANPGIIDPAISNVDNDINIRLALDPNGNVVVAASWNGSVGQVGVARYLSTGIFDNQFNFGNQFNIGFSVETSVLLTGLVTLTNNKILVSGYQADDVTPANNNWFVAELQYYGDFDDEFNTYGQIQGEVVFQVYANQIARHNYDMTVQTDGKIVFAGSESPAASQEFPLLVRMLNDQFVGPVAQYPGAGNPLPTPVVPGFGNNGIGDSNIIDNLLEGGYVVLNANNTINVGGLTQNNELVVAQFTTIGAIDTTYNSSGTPQGVAVSPSINNLSNGGPIAVDTNNKVVIGGFTNDGTLAAARFNTDGTQDTIFAGTGVVQTSAISLLSNGGYIAVDSNNKVIIGGITSDNQLVLARFTTIGDADGGFGSAGIAKSGAIANLTESGSIMTDAFNNVYVGGYTSDGTLIIAKFTSAGVLDDSFGTNGIAQTGVITNLSGVGSLAFDSFLRIVVGGFTSDLSLVAARFLPTGEFDPTFSSDGVAISNSIADLTIGGFVTVDDLNRIVVGGLVVSTYGNSMVVVRFDAIGRQDETIALGGVASTGTIDGLVQGGFTTVDDFDRIVLGGMVLNGSSAQLIIAKIYSGDEITISAFANLTPQDVKILYYGNNPDIFRRMILVDYYLGLIDNPEVKDAVTAIMNTILSNYIAKYGTALGFNLVWNMFKEAVIIEAARVYLDGNYTGSTDIIDLFFSRFNARLAILARP